MRTRRQSSRREDDVDPAERALAEREGLGVLGRERRVMAFALRPHGAPIAVGFYGGEWAQLFEGACAGFAGKACARAIHNGSYAGALETGLAAAREIHAELQAEAGEGE